MRGPKACRDILRDAETLARVLLWLSLSLHVGGQSVGRGLPTRSRSVRPHVTRKSQPMSTDRESVAAATRQAGNPGMRALTQRLQSGPGGAASKVAIPGPQMSARGAKPLGVGRDTSTGSGVAMRHRVGSTHRRHPSRLKSGADVRKAEVTVLATTARGNQEVQLAEVTSIAE